MKYSISLFCAVLLFGASLLTSCSNEEEALVVQEHPVLAEDGDFQTLLLSAAEMSVSAVQYSWAGNADKIRSYSARLHQLDARERADFIRMTGMTVEVFADLNQQIGQSIRSLQVRYPELSDMSADARLQWFITATQNDSELIDGLDALANVHGRCLLNEICMTMGMFLADIVHDYMCANGWASLCEGGFDGDLLGDLFESVVFTICELFPC